ncbi:hypothetical protein SAMN05444365_11450 [Micromonospora pattaloongensis]|uniref:Uncharacterized protein n=1 Tax=Micromonospora pattaloongensis TaxID=405436 RepID=A0A1H3STZ8_9ACTN|nr:hypothetical protein [Micromonospora pattaloongensis]SDZ41583.1 hypothetical protein SAMN05444365_11450 [Micromonospora pattaloongensis]
MAEHDSTSWDDLPVLRDAIAASLGAVYWTVHDGGWPEDQATPPDGVGDLLATPVVVGAAPFGPEERPLAPIVESGADPLTLIVRDVQIPAPAPAPPTLAPAPPLAPAPARPGRHRRVARVA